MHISLAAILEGVHISLVICVRGYTYHGDTHIIATPETRRLFNVFSMQKYIYFHL